MATSSMAEEEACPECGARHPVRDDVHGEVVCSQCGLVLAGGYIDAGPLPYNAGEEPTQGIGNPMTFTLHDKGLSTEIGRGASRTTAGGREGVNLYRLRRLHRRMRYSRKGERTLATALIQLDRMAGLMGLPGTFKEQAALLYRRAAARGLVRGRTIDGMAGASIYAVCRSQGVPRTLEEVARLTGVDRRDMTLAYRALLRGLRLGLTPPAAEDYLDRFASQLALDQGTEALARQIIRTMRELESRHSMAPMGTVAAAIYLAGLKTGHRIPQDRIGALVGVSEVTIRLRYMAMAKALGLTPRARS